MIEKGKIKLLNTVIVDETLLKHQKNLISNGNNSVSWGVTGGVSTNGNNRSSNELEYLEYIRFNNPSLKNKFMLWFYKKIITTTINPELKEYKEKKFTVEHLTEFFDSLKTNVNELKQSDIQEILNNYNSLLNNAQENKQIALIEKIKDYVEVLKCETIISTSKFNKYLTEEDVVKFYNIASKHKKYKTGLCLTYIKNFIKVIPNEITELKKEADLLKAFDNYVILHYDYSGKSVEDTKAEKAKKKDPILFGVIKDSKNLYYIGDWIDEYCDLTLDVIIKKLAKEVNELTKENVISNLNKI